jgi:uncharacterized UBP type Zn finger protein
MNDPCTHLNQIVKDVSPATLEGCEECLKNGGTWVSLRMCLTCGHIGCCDSSPGKHATAHYQETKKQSPTGHPIMKSFEPGENWMWCYEDEMYV